MSEKGKGAGGIALIISICSLGVAGFGLLGNKAQREQVELAQKAERRVAGRDGLDRPPDVELAFGPGDLVCTLGNEGTSPIAGIDLMFVGHHIEHSQCLDHNGGVTGGTHAASLGFRDTVSLTFGPLLVRLLQESQPVMFPSCPPGNCDAVLECRATFSRVADGKHFRKSAFLLIRPDGSAVPFEGSYSRNGPDGGWETVSLDPPLAERLGPCLEKTAQKYDALEAEIARRHTKDIVELEH